MSATPKPLEQVYQSDNYVVIYSPHRSIEEPSNLEPGYVIQDKQGYLVGYKQERQQAIEYCQQLQAEYEQEIANQAAVEAEDDFEYFPHSDFDTPKPPRNLHAPISTSPIDALAGLLDDQEGVENAEAEFDLEAIRDDLYKAGFRYHYDNRAFELYTLEDEEIFWGIVEKNAR